MPAGIDDNDVYITCDEPETVPVGNNGVTCELPLTIPLGIDDISTYVICELPLTTPFGNNAVT